MAKLKWNHLQALQQCPQTANDTLKTYNGSFGTKHTMNTWHRTMQPVAKRKREGWLLLCKRWKCDKSEWIWAIRRSCRLITCIQCAYVDAYQHHEIMQMTIQTSWCMLLNSKRKHWLGKNRKTKTLTSLTFVWRAESHSLPFWAWQEAAGPGNGLCTPQLSPQPGPSSAKQARLCWITDWLTHRSDNKRSLGVWLTIRRPTVGWLWWVGWVKLGMESVYLCVVCYLLVTQSSNECPNALFAWLADTILSAIFLAWALS